MQRGTRARYKDDTTTHMLINNTTTIFGQIKVFINQNDPLFLTNETGMLFKRNSIYKKKVK